MRLIPTAPVLALDATTAQVGIHRPAVLTRLSQQQMHFLASLEGGREVSDAEARRHRALLAELDAAGLLAPRPAARAVRFHDGGAIAVEAAIALARRGWRVAFADRARATRTPPGLTSIEAPATRAALAARRVQAVLPGAAVRSADAPADLDVVVSVGLPVTAVAPLLARDAPHLVVATDETGVTVGPLVVPGDGPCARCLALHATDDDPAWPRLGLQCEGRLPRADPLHAGAAGMLAARAAVAWADGRPVQSWRVGTDALEPVGAVAPHPLCRCTMDARGGVDVSCPPPPSAPARRTARA